LISEKTPERSGVFLCLEFVLLFGAAPLLVLAVRRPGALFLLLWLGALVTYRASAAARPAGGALAARDIQLVLLRFLAGGMALTMLTSLLAPGLFLSLPRTHPMFWAAIMVLYPVLSVWPQEVIFRRFLFYRYAAVFGQRGVVIASAVAFGFAHVIFLNWIAVALTLAGGAMFAGDYARRRSLWLACLEHGLYGCLIFTIGLGRFFYTGAAWHH
jgi:uncharacterized protein